MKIAVAATKEGSMEVLGRDSEGLIRILEFLRTQEPNRSLFICHKSNALLLFLVIPCQDITFGQHIESGSKEERGLNYPPPI